MTLNSDRAFFMLLVVLLAPLAAQALQLQPCVEVLIPKGMPIKMTVQRDESESQILKYIIKRTDLPKDTRRAKITTVMLDEHGTIKFMRSREGDHLSDPMSIATADTTVARVLLIVDWLETDRGKWVVDTKSQQVDIESLIKRGAKALPKSKFVGKQ